MRKFGLIGYPLEHSFSKKYFFEKFQSLGIQGDSRYDLYEIENVNDVLKLFEDDPELIGLNVTIPHKLAVIPILGKLDNVAQNIGAVNVIKRESDGTLNGYNSDFYGFQSSLLNFIGEKRPQAMILGNGGVSRAVIAVLQDLGISYTLVSRRKDNQAISYHAACRLLPEYPLIINCTPLGTSPKINEAPDLDYDCIGKKHLLFDLVYNPAESLFLQKGKNNGAAVQNGYDMLVFQAEKSWKIWNK